MPDDIKCEQCDKIVDMLIRYVIFPEDNRAIEILICDDCLNRRYRCPSCAVKYNISMPESIRRRFA